MLRQNQRTAGRGLLLLDLAGGGRSALRWERTFFATSAWVVAERARTLSMAAFTCAISTLLLDFTLRSFWNNGECQSPKCSVVRVENLRDSGVIHDFSTKFAPIVHVENTHDKSEYSNTQARKFVNSNADATDLLSQVYKSQNLTLLACKDLAQSYLPLGITPWKFICNCDSFFHLTDSTQPIAVQGSFNDTDTTD